MLFPEHKTTEVIFGMRLPQAYNGEEAYLTGQGLRTLALDTGAANTGAPRSMAAWATPRNASSSSPPFENNHRDLTLGVLLVFGEEGPPRCLHVEQALPLLPFGNDGMSRKRLAALLNG